MATPGFTAEHGFYRSTAHYQSLGYTAWQQTGSYIETASGEGADCTPSTSACTSDTTSATGCSYKVQLSNCRTVTYECYKCCSGGLTLCGDACKNLSTDPSNCGACGKTCPSDHVCCNGTCANLSGDASNCGTCGHGCPVPPYSIATCIDKVCQVSCQVGAQKCGDACCPSGGSSSGGIGEPCSSITLSQCERAAQLTYNGCKADCRGVRGTRCLDTCEAQYPPALQACQDLPRCTAALDCCRDVCTNPADFLTDSYNCGICGNVCPENASCIQGVCVCPSGQTLSNGFCCPQGYWANSGRGCCPIPQTNCSSVGCTDTSTDNNNCGSCGNICGGADTCAGGQCTSPCATCTNCHFDSFNFGWFIGVPTYLCRCNGRSCGLGNPVSGGTCCTSCPPGQTFCFNWLGWPVASAGACTDTSTDNNNCGGCGPVGSHTCDTSKGEQCINGNCQCVNPSMGCGSSGGQATTGTIVVDMELGAYSASSYQCTGSGTITISLGSSSQSKNYSYSGYSSIMQNVPACSATPVTFSNLQPGTWTIKTGRTTCTAQVTAGLQTVVQIVDGVCQ
jgi:hypothetical protein